MKKKQAIKQTIYVNKDDRQNKEKLEIYEY